MATDPGQVLLGRYRIMSLLGEGGMGAVYRAWDTRLNIPVALKEMLPQPDVDPEMLADLRDQFRQEAEVLARLQHPNLVRVTDFFNIDNRAYLVMDFVEGTSLANVITQHGAIGEPQVLRWAEQLLDALSYCHSQGILHRDIKPHNVIIRADGRPILVDFGLVKLWNPNNPHTRTAVRGVGTPEYAPPEQYNTGSGHTDERSDLYSLGATLYHVLTGQAPPSATQRIADPDQFQAPRVFVPGVSAKTESAILQAVELHRGKRWTSAGEMARAMGVTVPQWQPLSPQTEVALGAGASPSRTRAMPDAPPPQPQPRQRRGRGLWIAAAVVLLLLLCVGGAWAASSLLDIELPILSQPSTATVEAIEIVHESTNTPAPTEERAATRTPAPTDSPTPKPDSTDTPTPEVVDTPTPEPTATPTPTATQTPIPTRRSTSTPTPEPASQKPVPVSPVGGWHKPAVTFSWNGTLRSGQSYRVTAVHAESGTTRQADGLTGTSWYQDLPSDKFGEWRWRVAVMSGGNEVIGSDWVNFGMDPNTGGSSGPTAVPGGPATYTPVAGP